MDIRDVEVFRAGTHTDSAGRTRTYTHSDLARIAGSYDPSLHEAPAVIGHPATNAPAWGWVSRLSVAGDRLLADFRQVAPEFAQLLREGRFKKRSVSLFPDLRLRHVGFLGAAAPAVAGLKDVAFSGGESALEYSFEHAGADPHNPHSQEDEAMKTLLEKLQADVAALRTDLGQIKDAGQVASFSQRLAGIETQAKELAAGAEKAEAEAKIAKDDRDKLAREFSEFKEGQAKAGRAARFERLVKEGKALPGEKDQVLAFAEALAKDAGTINFAAPDGKAEQLPKEEAYWRGLETRQAHGLFNDFKAPAAGGDSPGLDLTDINRFA